MVKCTNGVAVIEVTEGAYNTIFKDQGYRPIADSEEQADARVPEEKDEIDSLLEKPIGQWSNDEVKAFAEAKGIDITGTKNAKEAKGRIRKFLEDAE